MAALDKDDKDKGPHDDKCKKNETPIAFASLEGLLDVEDQVSVLEGQMGEVDDQIDGLETQMEGLAIQLGGLDADVGDIGGQLGIVAAQLNGLASQVNGLDSDIGDLGGQLGSLAGELSPLVGRVSNLEADVGGLVVQLQVLVQRVSLLEGGELPPPPPPPPPPVDLAQLFLDVLGILNPGPDPTGVILPLIDPIDPASQTFNTAGAQEFTFTWSNQPNTLAQGGAGGHVQRVE